jgi:hypothetical protein
MTEHTFPMGQDELERVREWAIAKINGGTEPPWSWYQLMKLREAIDAILAGMAVTQPMEDSRGSAPQRGGGLRLVGAADPQETAPPRPAQRPIPLPM